MEFNQSEMEFCSHVGGKVDARLDKVNFSSFSL